MNKKTFLRATLALAAACAAPAFAQTPATGTPISIVVPYPAGGISDIFARALAPTLGKILGRNVVVENITGASGSIAASKVLNAPPNGNLLFMGSPTEVVLAPVTLKAVKYQASDFRLLGLVTQAPLALYVRGDLPVNSVDELLAYARKPGAKELSYGSTGPGSLYHLAGEGLREAAGLHAVHIPYRGGMPLLQDLMGSSVDMTLLPADGTIAKMAEGGKMKAIAVAAPARSPRFPNVQTFAESKALPQFTAQGVWGGVMVPAAMPEALVVQLHKALSETLASPEVRQALDAAGGAMPPIMSLAQAAAFYQTESTKLIAAAKAAKLEPN
ncbi:MAG TPA: tripartite tricarboxylate transporter substrate binding protein [Burkholderiaceae bacterium]|nr:tripartite tricarboxylate transporter substrate binding protein [Burkholderiaceae bacterium]